jgi:hypothetical protein
VFAALGRRLPHGNVQTESARPRNPENLFDRFACFPFLLQPPRLMSWSQAAKLADHGLYIAKRGGAIQNRGRPSSAPPVLFF